MDGIKDLSNYELARELQKLGLRWGPITQNTRKVFESILKRHYRDNVEAPPENNNIEVDTEPSQSILVEKVEESPKEETKEVCCYYGIAYSKQDDPEENTTEEQMRVVSSFQDAVKVSKGVKGSRFKCFPSRLEARTFSLSTLTTVPAPIKEDELVSFVSPTPQQLIDFRKNIENGNLDWVRNNIHENPYYIISAYQTPVIVQEGSRYNAMHVGVKSNQLQMCQLIIQILGDDEFLGKLFPDKNPPLFGGIKARMLDLFVNSPEKGVSHVLVFTFSLGGAMKSEIN